MKPTDEQRAAIDHDGSMISIAKPGSGKTFVLSRKIAAILGDLPDHRGVIAISYTNKASDELRLRVAASGIDSRSSFFGTIDRFCDSELIIPFLTQLWGRPTNDIYVTRLRDLPSEEQRQFEAFQEHTTGLQGLEKHFSVLKSYFLDGQIFLEATGILALYTLTHSQSCQRYIKARYSHVIIDEYQDSGIEQHDLFLKLHSLGLVAIAVGDADQSIFGFSNKDSKYLLSLARNPAFQSFPITYNHRCHASITNYSLRFVDENSHLSDVGDDIRVFAKRCVGTSAAIARWIDASLPQLMRYYSHA
jgi:superfamily I DNA/RNA helicase